MDIQGIIAVKQVAGTASIQSGTTAIAFNPTRSSFAIQNQGTSVLYVLLGGGATSTNFHFSLKGGSANDDGNGGTLSQAEGVVYVGTVSVAGSLLRYTTLETS